MPVNTKGKLEKIHANTKAHMCAELAIIANICTIKEILFSLMVKYFVLDISPIVKPLESSICYAAIAAAFILVRPNLSFGGEHIGT